MRSSCSLLLAGIAVAVLILHFPGLSSARTIHKDSLGLYDLDNKNNRCSIRLQSGLVTGSANEIVYAGSDSDELLSKLTWDIDEQYMLGLGASVQKQWVALHADAWFAVADGRGTMDDYDWFLPGQDWTHWSHHDDTTVSEAYLLDLNVEFLISRISTEKFLVSAFLGYKREHFEWEARGGSFIYSDAAWRDTQGNFPPGQLGITYSQTFASPYIGLGLRGGLGKFEFNGRIAVTNLAAVEAKDTHHLRNLSTEANLNDGTMYSVDITGNYAFTDKMALEVAYSYTEYDTMRGNSTYEWTNLGAATFADSEGADLKTSMFSIIFAYTF